MGRMTNGMRKTVNHIILNATKCSITECAECALYESAVENEPCRSCISQSTATNMLPFKQKRR